MQLSILVIDLVGYSERLAALDEQVGNAGETLNRQIETFVGNAVAEAGLTLEATLLKFTGDGAILKAPNPERAHRIAMALQGASAEFNRGKQTELGKRVFRVGMATGDVAPYESASGSRDFGGPTIGRAARMEAGCEHGGVMIDEASYAMLPRSLQAFYHGPETLTDKNNARYRCYRYDSRRLTRLQAALAKHLDSEPAAASFEAVLLEKLTFVRGIPDLLAWLEQPGNDAAYAIEKLRTAILQLRSKHRPDDGARQLVVWLFLVFAEYRLNRELKASDRTGELKFELNDQSARNLVAAAVKDCGLQFEVDARLSVLKPRNIVDDFSLYEPGMPIEHNLFQEIVAAERVLRKLHPLARGEEKLDQESLLARLRVLEESENLQIVLAFGPETTFATDHEVHVLLHTLGVPFFHYGVPASEATAVARTTREVAEALRAILADLLQILANEVMTVPPNGASPEPNKPLVFLSYSRHVDDARYKQAFELQLRALEHLGLIRLFIDVRNIAPGQYWDATIRQALAETSIAIFLLSQHFMASNYIMHHEVPELSRLIPQGRAVPVVVRDCLWTLCPLGALQAPFNARPLAALNDEELVTAATTAARHVATLAKP
ncbi:MAG: TIR domain-containing protein [Xanthomonadales bacterium]|jgi:class 3 adenylate cyclase|nr:TIR domain-containing protein [Xanthomonadales bacterium]